LNPPLVPVVPLDCDVAPVVGGKKAAQGLIGVVVDDPEEVGVVGVGVTPVGGKNEAQGLKVGAVVGLVVEVGIVLVPVVVVGGGVMKAAHGLKAVPVVGVVPVEVVGGKNAPQGLVDEVPVVGVVVLGDDGVDVVDDSVDVGFVLSVEVVSELVVEVVSDDLSPEPVEVVDDVGVGLGKPPKPPSPPNPRPLKPVEPVACICPSMPCIT